MEERKPDRVTQTLKQKKRVGDRVITTTHFYDLIEKNNKVDKHLLSGILTVAIAFLLVLRVGGVVLGLNTNFTFTSFLEALSSIKTIDTAWIGTLGTYVNIHTSSKLLNALIGSLISVIQVASWITVSSLNLIHIIVMFIGIFFGVSI